MVAVNGIGSTNHSTAWDMSDTGQSFKEGRLNPRHHLMADDVYTPCEQMPVPYSGKNLLHVEVSNEARERDVHIGDSFLPEFQWDGASDPPSRGNTRTANRSSKLREDICEALAERGFQRSEVGRRLPRRDR